MATNDIKIFNTQDNLTIELIYDSLPGDVASAKIKYTNQNGSGYFNATLDEVNQRIYYQLPAGSPLLVSGKWVFWAYLVLANGKVHPSSSETVYILTEGS